MESPDETVLSTGEMSLSKARNTHSQIKLKGFVAAALLGIASSATIAMPTAALTYADVASLADAGGRAGVTLAPSQCPWDAKTVTFCASVVSLARGSGFASSGLAPGDKILAVESFRPADFPTEIKLLRSMPPGSVVRLTVTNEKGTKRQIAGRMVAESALVSAAQNRLAATNLDATKPTEIEQYVARAKAKDKCEQQYSKTVPNVVGGALGTKVGVAVAPAVCTPWLGTIAAGDPGIAYLTCVGIVTIAGTASGVVVASSTVDSLVKECTDSTLRASR